MHSPLVAASSGFARRGATRGITILACLTIAVAHATDGYAQGTVVQDSSWDRQCFFPGPKAAPINLQLPLVPGRVTILFLDGHTSLPIERARLQARPGADTSVVWTRYADSHGIATIDSVPPGRVLTQFAAIGYYAKRDTLTLNGSEGHFLVVQLEASYYCLEPIGSSDGAARREPP